MSTYNFYTDPGGPPAEINSYDQLDILAGRASSSTGNIRGAADLNRRTGVRIDTEGLVRGLDEMSGGGRALGGLVSGIGGAFRRAAGNAGETRSDLGAAVAGLEDAVVRPADAAVRQIMSSFEGTAARGAAARGAAGAAAPSQAFPPPGSVTL